MAIHNLLPEFDPTPDANAAPVVDFAHVSLGFDGKPVLNEYLFYRTGRRNAHSAWPCGCAAKAFSLKLANGLIRPDSGEIRVFGEEVTSLRETICSNCENESAWSFRRAPSLIRSPCATTLPIN